MYIYAVTWRLTGVKALTRDGRGTAWYTDVESPTALDNSLLQQLIRER
jgi:hypothetical protein